MKQIFVIIGIIAVIAAVYITMSIERVGQGEVGVVYSIKDGVQEETLSPGFHFVGPFYEVTNYPVSQQQLVLSNNDADFGTKTLEPDTHIDAPADGGMVKINMTVNYQFMPEKVTELYSRFNGMDGEQIVNTKVKNSIIAYIKEVTPSFSVMDIYSDKRAEVSQAITEYLNTKLQDEYGIQVVSALIIDVQLDETLQAKVQAKEQAKQDAEKAELDKQTAIAQGEAAKAEAEAQAEVKKIQTDADVDRYNRIGAAITPELLQKWEMDARLKHGWVTVNGANSVVTTN